MHEVVSFLTNLELQVSPSSAFTSFVDIPWSHEDAKLTNLQAESRFVHVAKGKTTLRLIAACPVQQTLEPASSQDDSFLSGDELSLPENNAVEDGVCDDDTELSDDGESTLSSWSEQGEEEVSGRSRHITFEEIATSPSTACTNTTRLAEGLEMIQFLVTILYKLPIRRPAAAERLKKRMSETASNYQHFDVLFVQDLFPSADPAAAVRLGRLVSLRRHILSYRQNHNDRMQLHEMENGQSSDGSTQRPYKRAHMHADQDIQIASSQDMTGDVAQSTQAESQQISLPSKATTHHRQEGEDNFLYPPSIAPSEASRASTYAVHQLQVAVPPMPANEHGRLTHFLCPYCLITQHIRSERVWRKHVFDDLQPYVCTFTGCAHEDHFFSTREEWYQHEVKEHRHVWHCNTDSHDEHGTQEDFINHMITEHEVSFAQEELESLSSMFRRSSRRVEGTCNLCKHVSQNLRSHVARHLQRIALFALPRPNVAANTDSANAQNSWHGDLEHEDHSSQDSRTDELESRDLGSIIQSPLDIDHEANNDLILASGLGPDDAAIPDTEEHPAWHRTYVEMEVLPNCRRLIAKIVTYNEQLRMNIRLLGRELSRLNTPEQSGIVKDIVDEFRAGILQLHEIHPHLRREMSPQFWISFVVEFDLRFFIRDYWDSLHGPNLLSPALRLTRSLAGTPPDPATIKIMLEQGVDIHKIDDRIDDVPWYAFVYHMRRTVDRVDVHLLQIWFEVSRLLIQAGAKPIGALKEVFGLQDMAAFTQQEPPRLNCEDSSFTRRTPRSSSPSAIDIHVDPRTLKAYQHSSNVSEEDQLQLAIALSMGHNLHPQLSSSIQHAEESSDDEEEQLRKAIQMSLEIGG
jgi:hypothetical protein